MARRVVLSKDELAELNLQGFTRVRVVDFPRPLPSRGFDLEVLLEIEE